ncbi:hypothetical protein BT69DRAFT_1351329 [Atractiella rhizophila]|nr:hypothetical protein BT69DRAFT_1352898 [Atractiella rhizophila]KAH8921876.1 hypothetical protein BT69DRAFT_1351329 [Atractiella rhizophila]
MSYQWVSQHSGQEIPQNAIKGGHEADGKVFYIARTHHDGSVQLGKVGETTGRGILFPYGGKEEYSGNYEILTGDMNTLKWIDWQDQVNEPGQGWNPVEGGKDKDGSQLFVAVASHEGCEIPGKTGMRLPKVCFGYGGKEHEAKNYKVLAVK